MHPERPTRRATLGAAILVTLLTLGAALPAAGATEETLETYPFDADGRIRVENVNGDIEVVGWDREEIELQVIKTADDPEILAELEVEIHVDRRELRITTDYPDRRDSGWFGGDHGEMSVDYRLKVPRGARVDEIDTVNGGIHLEGLSGTVAASTVNGGIDARDLAGEEIELSTVNGSVEADFASLGGRQRVDLSSVNGRVEITVPAGADATIDASTVHGSLRDDFDFRIDEDRHVGAELEGRLGSGSATVELETVNGSVRINRG